MFGLFDDLISRLSFRDFFRSLKEDQRSYEASRSFCNWPFFISFSSSFYRSKRRKKFFGLFFPIVAKFARADGQLTDYERELIEGFMDCEFGMNYTEKIEAFKIMRQAASSKLSFEDYSRKYYGEFSKLNLMTHNAIFLLIALSYSDGHFCEQEHRLINAANKIFKISKDDYEDIKKIYFKRVKERNKYFKEDSKDNRHKTRKNSYYHQERQYKRYQRQQNQQQAQPAAKESKLDKAYAVLGVKPDATMSNIKSAYRKLVKKYHPDALAGQGVPEEFLIYSRTKFIQVQEAYELICERR